MKKTLTLLGLISLVAIFVSSCSKDDDNPADNPKTATEYLTAGNWKMTALTVNPGINFGGGTITNFYAQMPACTTDDLTKFNSDGTITDDEGATKCDPGDPQSTTEGTWVLSEDNSTLTMDYPEEDPTVLTIVELNGSSLKGTYTIIEDFGAGPEAYTFAVTLSLQ